jgi:hypothetical protein
MQAQTAREPLSETTRCRVTQTPRWPPQRVTVVRSFCSGDFSSSPAPMWCKLTYLRQMPTRTMAASAPPGSTHSASGHFGEKGISYAGGSHKFFMARLAAWPRVSVYGHRTAIDTPAWFIGSKPEEDLTAIRSHRQKDVVKPPQLLQVCRPAVSRGSLGQIKIPQPRNILWFNWIEAQGIDPCP